MIITYNSFTFNADQVVHIGYVNAANMDQTLFYFEVGLSDGKIFLSPQGSKDDVTLRRDIFIDYLNDHRPPLDVDRWIQDEVDRKAEESASRPSA